MFGDIITTTPSRLYGGNRCSRCSHRSYKYDIDEIRKTIEDDDFTLISTTYENNKTPLTVRCNSCDTIKEISYVSFIDTRYNNCTCKKHSIPILDIHNILNDHDIYFESEKRFSDCRRNRPLPFDIYLKDHNTLIEYDGIQHFKPIYGQKRLDNCRISDMIKNNYCRNNNINLIRITCYDDHIKLMNNLVQRLSKTHLNDGSE